MLYKLLIFLLLTIYSFSVTAVEPEQPKYYVVQFTLGPNWEHSLTPQEQNGFKEHSANLNRLRKDKIITFGARHGDVGMIILKSDSINGARELIESDPGVKSGIFVFKVERLNVFYSWKD